MNRKSGLMAIAACLLAIGFLAAGCELDGGVGTGLPEGVVLPPGVALEDLALCCNTARGGGSIQITEPSGATHKATFGFQMTCKKDAEGRPVVSGQLEYQDHRPWTNGNGVPVSVSFHGISKDQGYAVGECTPKKGGFTGTYKPQPESLGEGGNFYVAVEDKEKPGPSNGDTFTIAIQSGVFAGYSQTGTLSGGNIKAF